MRACDHTQQTSPAVSQIQHWWLALVDEAERASVTLLLCSANVTDLAALLINHNQVGAVCGAVNHTGSLSIDSLDMQDANSCLPTTQCDGNHKDIFEFSDTKKIHTTENTERTEEKTKKDAQCFVLHCDLRVL